MIKNEFNVVGVMSGTSLDGIDLAYITFQKETSWSFNIHFAETIPYHNSWSSKLKNLTELSLEAISVIDEEYTDYLSDIIKKFIDRHQISNVDAVCSHGHTALHQPQNGLTYQIGNLPKIAGILNLKVVCDFRVKDVALGGQGAPLVPIGDKLLFSEYDHCLNLGGFANISTDHLGQRIAYDICPVNIVLNHYVNNLGFDYDDKGEIAKSGEIQPLLLQQLNELSYYSQSFPKSLGQEWVAKEIFPLIDSFQLETTDILRTFIEHVSIQITNNLQGVQKCNILVSGGGAYNDFLISRIKASTKHIIIIPERNITEFKEALIFGLLGVLKLRDETNCLKSVTGASKDHSSGKVYCP